MHADTEQPTEHIDLVQFSHDRFDRAAAHVPMLKRGLVEFFKVPARSITVHFPVVMDDGSVGNFQGHRVLHRRILAPGKGGVCCDLEQLGEKELRRITRRFLTALDGNSGPHTDETVNQRLDEKIALSVDTVFDELEMQRLKAPCDALEEVHLRLALNRCGETSHESNAAESNLAGILPSDAQRCGKS